MRRDRDSGTRTTGPPIHIHRLSAPSGDSRPTPRVPGEVHRSRAGEIRPSRVGGWKGRAASLATLSAVWFLALSAEPALGQGNAVAVVPTIIPSPTPVAVLGIRALYYDLDGRAGLVDANSYPTTPTARTSVFFGEDTGLSDLEAEGVGLVKDYPGPYDGTPYDFLFEIPGVGDYLGSNLISCCNPTPYFVIPTTSQLLGKTMEPVSQHVSYNPPPPNGEYMGLAITPYISSQSDHGGYAAGALASDQVLLQVTATVDFYTTSGLEPSLRQRRTLPLRTGLGQWSSYGDVVLLWTGYSYDLDPNYWEIDFTVPANPLLQISLAMDGYSTETITIVPKNLTEFYWYPLLRPLPDRPDVYRPDGLPISFCQIPTASMTERMEDIANAILFSTSGPDENQDGSVDVSDILRVLKDGYP